MIVYLTGSQCNHTGLIVWTVISVVALITAFGALLACVLYLKNLMKTMESKAAHPKTHDIVSDDSDED